MVKENYKEIHENVAKLTEDFRKENPSPLVVDALLKAQTQAISKQIQLEAYKVQNPGYILFISEDEEVEEEDIESTKVSKTKEAEEIEEVKDALEEVEETPEEIEKVTEELIDDIPAEIEEAHVEIDETVETGQDGLVYTSKTGDKYHRITCQYYRKTFKGMTEEEAKELGKKACEICAE